jgi:hypothetical protein
MHETILNLAQTLSGAAETEVPILELLCTAAEQEWTSRLRDGVNETACQSAYVCACAFSAVAALSTGRSEKDGVSSFTAGDVTVHAATGSQTGETAAALYAQAARLMEPYARFDDFAFRGVRA